MIRELLIFASEAKSHHRVAFSNTEVNLRSGSRLPRVSKNLIMLGVDQCIYENGKLKCDGWAYCRDTYEPVKRVFVAVRGRLLGPATPVLRVDVRQNHGITYDNTGFNIVADAEHIIFNSETVQIFLVTGKGVVVHEVKCQSDIDNPYVAFNISKVSRESVSISSESQSIDFKLSDQFRMHIDTIKMDDDSVIVRGWAVFLNAKDASIYVGVGVSQRLLSCMSICSRPRPDVSRVFAGQVNHDLHGFTLVVPRSDLQNGEENICVFGLIETFNGRFAGLASQVLDWGIKNSDDLELLIEYSTVFLNKGRISLARDGDELHFVEDDRVHIAIDEVETSGDQVRISGWCAHMVNPSLRLYAGLRIGDKMVSLGACSVTRPDVAKAIGIETAGAKFGFQIYVDRIEIENADSQNLGIVSICRSHGCGRATVGLKSTAQFGGSYLHKVKHLLNNFVPKSGLSLLRQSIKALPRTRS